MIKICTLNTRGLRDNKKRGDLFSYLKKEQYDICFLQETYITTKDIGKWKLEWGKHFFACPHMNNSRGLVILISKSLEISNIEEVACEKYQTRIQILKFEYNQEENVLCNVYAPNSDIEKAEFFKQFGNILLNIDNINNMNCVIAGDMNCILEETVDNIAGSKFNYMVVEKYKEMVKNLELTDVFRYLNGNIKRFTWHRKSPFTARRLDYIFVTNSMVHNCKSSEIQQYHRSDHSIVSLTLYDNLEQGKGYWKLNDNHLKDKTYVDMINKVIDQTVIEFKNIDSQLLWELCKSRIKTSSIKFSIAKRKSHKNQLEIIKSKLNDIESRLGEKQTPLLLKEFDHMKLQHELLLKTELIGAQVRSRIKWVEEGERNTRYFLSLEKFRAKKKQILSLKKENGETVETQAEILDVLVDFYSNLYDKKTDLNKKRLSEFINGVNLPAVTDTEKQSCEGELTKQECSICFKKI